jgi:hypothetical protein
MIMIKSRRMQWARHVVFIMEIRNTYIILVGKPEGRHWNTLEDNIKMYIMEIEFQGVEWIHLAQDRGQ